MADLSMFFKEMQQLATPIKNGKTPNKVVNFIISSTLYLLKMKKDSRYIQ